MRCKQYFGLEQGAQIVDEYYNQVVTTSKERDMYQPLSTDLKKNEKAMSRCGCDSVSSWFEFRV
jgi:hypothetical protein